MTFSPLTIYRFSRFLHTRGFRRTASVVKYLNGWLFHTILPPEMEVGSNLVLCHLGFGVVIHPNTVIGNNVRIHHQVTLAADVAIGSSLQLCIEDNVTIGAGAIVLGPRRIGKGAYVGAGAVVTKDVPAGAVVAGNPARIIREARVLSQSGGALD